MSDERATSCARGKGLEIDDVTTNRFRGRSDGGYQPLLHRLESRGINGGAPNQIGIAWLPEGASIALWKAIQNATTAL